MKFIAFVFAKPDDNIVLNLERINYCRITSTLIMISFEGQTLSIFKKGFAKNTTMMDEIDMESDDYDRLKEILINMGLKGE